MAYYSNSARRTNKRLVWMVCFIALLASIGGAYAWIKTRGDVRPAETAVKTEPNRPAAPKPSQNSSLPLVDLQPTINAWAKSQSGTASIVIYDLANHKTVASLNPDRQYFTASIYKLYVAYNGYQKIADGTYRMNEPYLNGYTRGQCLDKMIRESYSPCGEKMWAELGKETIESKLKTYGLKNTDMTGLRTSASDAAIILQRLYEKRDLSEEHTGLLLDSMKTQPEIYRRGLPQALAGATVYNKVGWNELKEWHDTAIVTLPGDRSYVVTVFTENVGTRNIRDLAERIKAKLTE